MNNFELFALLAAVAVLGIYHGKLTADIRRKPLQTVIGYSAIKRREWVRSVMTDKRDILAVQTLRNWSMASSFLATTAILIATSVLHFLLTVPSPPPFLQQINFLGTPDQVHMTIKLFGLLVAMLTAFFNFAVAIRYYNHVSIEINVPHAAPEHDLAAITNLMDRGSLHYTVGMRCFYLAIPLALWLFGAFWLLLGSVMLALALHAMDRLPVKALPR